MRVFDWKKLNFLYFLNSLFSGIAEYAWLTGCSRCRTETKRRKKMKIFAHSPAIMIDKMKTILQADKTPNRKRTGKLIMSVNSVRLEWFIDGLPRCGLLPIAQNEWNQSASNKRQDDPDAQLNQSRTRTFHAATPTPGIHWPIIAHTFQATNICQPGFQSKDSGFWSPSPTIHDFGQGAPVVAWNTILPLKLHDFEEQKQQFWGQEPGFISTTRNHCDSRHV